MFSLCIVIVLYPISYNCNTNMFSNNTQMCVICIGMENSDAPEDMSREWDETSLERGDEW